MERKKIKFRFVFIFFIVYALVVLWVCGTVLFRACFPYAKYNEKWIIGKTQAEIEERYGEFDLKFDVALDVIKLDSIGLVNDLGDNVEYLVDLFSRCKAGLQAIKLLGKVL